MPLDTRILIDQLIQPLWTRVLERDGRVAPAIANAVHDAIE